MAFNSHKKSLLVLFILTDVSLLCLITGCGFNMFSGLCYVTRSEENLSMNVEHLKDVDDGICSAISFYSLLMNDDPNNWVVLVSVIIPEVIYSLPILAYLILNEPHDCYVCLGKDPDRIYS